MSPDLSSSLHTHFGFKSFRAGQEEAIQSLLNKNQTLAIMPTGAGKSLIYQFAALQLEGLTLVISPLIALMKDQVDALNRKGIPATFINSAISTAEHNQRLTLLSQGKYRLVYVAPERLRSVTFLRSLQNRTLSLLAVDEAHCISEWGHDFRPDYLHIAEARIKLEKPLTVALTATATPKVQSDIVRLLGMPEATKRIVTGFNRPNLTLEVKYTADTEAKFRALKELLHTSELNSDVQGSSIIYAGTRRDTEEVAEFVRVVCKLQAEHYHAGLLPEDRTRIQERFISGATPVIVATNAFGMGIDRADVRQVIHYSVPGSLEAYYQEAGRAGRDGHPATAVLLYDPQDRALQEFFIQNSMVTSSELQSLYRVLGNSNDEAWLTTEDFQRRTELHPVKIKVGLAELERIGALEHLGDDGYRMSLKRQTWNQKEVENAATRSREHIRHRTAQLDHMIHYAETNSCRRKIVLKHFGDHGSADALICCDNCESQKSIALPATSGDVSQMTQADGAALVILDTSRKLKYRVGTEKLAQILAGSKSKELKKFNYDKSPYFARLNVFRKSEIVRMIEQLVEMEFFKIVGGMYPVVALTPKGESALKQKVAIPLKTPKSKDFEINNSHTSSSSHVQHIVALGESKSSSALPDLIKALKSNDGNARRLAASALGKIKNTQAVQPLMDLLATESKPQVRQYAVKALGSIRDSRAISLLERISKDENEQYYTQDSAKIALQRCRNSKYDKTSKAFRQNKQIPPDDGEIERLILDCVKSLPAKLPRSGVAKLLVGSLSERVETYQSHTLYNSLEGKSRSEVMVYVDKLLENGQLQKADNGYLVLGNVQTNQLRITRNTQLATPIPHPATDSISSFLSSSHPRPLKGNWQTGFALDFHSSYKGAEWNRSGIGDLVYRLKYEADSSALPTLVEHTRKLFTAYPEMRQFDLIIPVPSSTPREFSPVYEFCKAVSQAINKPMQTCVIKTRQTQPQKEMHTLPQKRDNVAGAFAVKDDITGKRVLLVDDLFDSGATLEEITRLLRNQGAENINVLTLTRTIHSDT
jgi:ATP-dependent DNA helicase RecQ